MGLTQINHLVRALKAGQPVIIFDDPKREGEADLVVHAGRCTPSHIRRLRTDGGGLVCLVTDAATGEALGLDYATNQMKAGRNQTLRRLAIPRMPYGDPSPFSVFINSRKTYTGISDDDRTLTIKTFEKLVRAKKGNALRSAFLRSFYAPGHVALLLARPIEKRHGHTELVSALAAAAGLSPAVVICEMLANDGKALSWKGAKAYARRNGFLAVDGKTLLKLLGKEKR